MRNLIINADDFGYTADVNEGIVEAHVKGILTSATLMANGPAFEYAVQLARQHPSLDVGCHLVLVGENSLITGHALPVGPRQLLAALALGRLDVRAELRAQIQKIIQAGIVPSHLDTHKHTHLVPSVFRVVCRLAHDFGIPWVRLSLDDTVRFAGMSPVRAQALYRGIARRSGVMLPDHFLGFRLTGSLTDETLAQALGSVRPGLTEFMCHPGRWGAELAAANTRLRRERQIELEALTSPRIRQLIANQGIVLTSFRNAAA